MTTIDTEALRALVDAATPIAAFPGYRVSRDGSVWSFSGWRGAGVRRITAVEGPSGYLKVRLSTTDGARTNRAVHRLVAEAFLAPRPAGAQIRHLNGNKVDNRADNLAWGSALDNAADREMHGTTARGERNGWTRLSEDIVREVRRLRSSGLLYREVAALTGVDRIYAQKIATRRVWAHVA